MNLHLGQKNWIRALTDRLLKWIDSFLYRFNIVIRKQSGCLTRSIARTAYIEKHVSYQLVRLKELFEDGTLDENYVENMDETHFVFNMDNHYTLGIRGVDSVNYADVVGGADAFTMVLRLRGGPNARLEAPFIIFKNRNSNYPMMNLPDNIEGVSYRTQPQGWMDNNVFLQWVHESRAICTDPDGRSRTLFSEIALDTDCRILL